MSSFDAVIEFQQGKLLNNRYYIDSKLGQGSFGRVYKALDQKTKEVVAIKQYLINSFKENPKLQELFNQELKLLKSIKSQHVIRYIDDFSNNDSSFLVSEFCNQGDLSTLLVRKKIKNEKISEQEVISYFKQILSGLMELHKQQGVHRDLKLENILISQNCLKIADFGFAKSIVSVKDVNRNVLEKDADFGFVKNVVNVKDVTSTVCGTLSTMAPEILEGKPYGMEVDVYSLGVCLYQLLYGYLPYDCKNYNVLKKQIQIIIQKINYDDPYVKISKEMKNLLQRMICYDRKFRIRWDQIYDHEILQYESQANSILLPGSIIKMPDHKQEAINLYHKFKHLMITDNEHTDLQGIKPNVPQEENLSIIDEEASSSRSDNSKDYYQLKKDIEEQQIIDNCIQDTKQKYEQQKLMLIQLYQTFMHNCQIVKTIRNRIIQLALAKKAYMMASDISESLNKDKNFFKVQYFQEFLKEPFYQQIKGELIQSEKDFQRLYQSCKQEIQPSLYSLHQEQQKKERLIKIIEEEINQNIFSDNITNLIKLGIAYSYSNINSDLNVLKNEGKDQSVYYQSFILVSGCLKQDSLFKQDSFNLAYYIFNVKQLSLQQSKKQFDELIDELNIKYTQL
ncbi:hypothetical protein ABPG72_000671 [Tetrahymena utriculariae]